MAPLLVLAAGTLGLLVVVLHQRRQIAELAERVAAASRFDPLTGLLNRRAFEERLEGTDYRPAIPIVPAALGERAGAVGAAVLARTAAR